MVLKTTNQVKINRHIEWPLTVTCSSSLKSSLEDRISFDLGIFLPFEICLIKKNNWEKERRLVMQEYMKNKIKLCVCSRVLCCLNSCYQLNIIKTYKVSTSTSTKMCIWIENKAVRIRWDITLKNKRKLFFELDLIYHLNWYSTKFSLFELTNIPLSLSLFFWQIDISELIFQIARMNSIPVDVKVHPTVLFSVVDNYERRNEKMTRVVGTLLGTNIQGNIEVTDCFVVPHRDADEVRILFRWIINIRSCCNVV